MSHDLPPETIDEIRSAIFAGQKIKAIKLYREASGKGLKDSKEFIDALSERLYEESPDQFKSAPSSSSGCAGVVLLSILLIAALLSALGQLG